MARCLWLCLAAALLASLTVGCAKRVPLELQEGRFDPTQRVAVTFRDGSELVGKVAENASVKIVHQGSVYRGKILELTFDEIRVTDCRLVRNLGDSEAEMSRLTQAAHEVGEPVQELVLRIDQVERVEHVTIDALRTTSQSIFWTLTGAVTAFLMADRS